MTAKPTRILAVDDEIDFLRTLSEIFTNYNYNVSSCGSGSEALQLIASETHDAVILDLGMPGLTGTETMREIHRVQPDMPVIVLTADNRVDSVVEAMKLGAYDYFTKPVEWRKLETSLRKVLPHGNDFRRPETKDCFDSIIGKSRQIRNVILASERVSDTHAPLLITGERGTGKELLARMIHCNGPRKNQPFVVIHCGAMAAEQLDGEVFGHESNLGGTLSINPGRLEQADGGTLYLDEIAEMPKQTQMRFLRLLQEQHFQRIGGTQNVVSDVRIISAGDKDLSLAMRRGEFREDLYYRIAVYPIRVPPLRERCCDIPLLAGFFMQQFNLEYGRHLKTILPQTMDSLTRYSWPGNVRELRGLLLRSFLNATGTLLEPKHLPMDLISSLHDSNGERVVGSISFPSHDNRIVPMKVIEKEVLVRALKLTNYNMSSAASELGIGRTTLYRKLRKYRIELRR